MALFGLLGDQKDLASRTSVANAVMKSAYGGPREQPTPPIFSKIIGAHVEVYLRENATFRCFLRRSVFRNGPYHLYADRCRALGDKLSRQVASLEGNTNVDAVLSGRDAAGRWMHVFVEAKFASDISTSISYLPVRNQIARNIDCAMDVMTAGGTVLDGLNSFWFVLLTPGMFRAEAYGGPVPTPLDSLCPSRSRLYCYKMDDYLRPSALERDLPHWHGRLTDQQWSRLSSRIGWLTYESILKWVASAPLLTGEALRVWLDFLRHRGLTAA
jgi:hypothetical protein